MYDMVINLINPILSCLCNDFVIRPTIEYMAPKVNVKVKKEKYSRIPINPNENIPFKITSPSPIPFRDTKYIEINTTFPTTNEDKLNLS